MTEPTNGVAADSPRTLVVTMPYFEELKLRVADKSVEDLADPIGDEAFDGNPVWSDLLLLIDPLLSDRMKEAGWVADGCTWEDFHVLLDHERRVVVQDMERRKLARWRTNRTIIAETKHNDTLT